MYNDQPVLYSDFGTKEQQKKRKVKIGWSSDTQQVARVEYASLLELYLGTQRITQRQFDAGVIFCKCWYRTGKSSKITSKLFGDPESSGRDFLDIHNEQVEAEIEYSAITSKMGIVECNAVINLCCLEEHPKNTEDLRRGLNHLVRYYQL